MDTHEKNTTANQSKDNHGIEYKYVFQGNADAIAFNRDSTKETELLRSLKRPQDAFAIASAAYVSPDFLKQHLIYLIEQGFLGKEDYPYISDNGAKIHRDRLYLPAGIMFYTAVSGDYSLLQNSLIYTEVKKSLLKTPDSSRQAVMQYDMCVIGHEIMNDRLFTVSCAQKLSSHFSVVNRWKDATTRDDIKEISCNLTIPDCYAQLSVIKKIYGVSVYNNCISVCPACSNLPSIRVCINGKEALITYTEGYPKKIYCEDIAFYGSMSLSNINNSVVLTVTC